VLFIPPGVEIEELTDDMVLPGSNIVIGPFAGHSQIKEVEFVKSSARARDCPKDDRPEIAILGRSNVGKSSLINCLVRKKEVALTSKKPGKTQLINHFLVNKSWYIVDLPGYGYVF
jgi:GTP-binding protein